MSPLLRNVDASWLRMDDPANLMVVTGVLVLDVPVPVERIRALLEKRIVGFRRFTSRVVPPGLASGSLPGSRTPTSPSTITSRPRGSGRAQAIRRSRPS